MEPHRIQWSGVVPDISKALGAYKPEYRLVDSFEYGGGSCASQVYFRFCEYPFVEEQMPYSSLNLLNLAIEQAAIVHVDCMTIANAHELPWNGVEEFRERVSAGEWLVGRIETRVLKPADTSELVPATSRLLRFRWTKGCFYIQFSVDSPRLFSSKGMAALPFREE